MANSFYQDTGSPSTGSQGSSSTMRGEFALIEAGFDKMPVLTANGGKLIAVDAGGSALESITTTGTGSGVRATSPTFAGTVVAVALTMSGQLTNSVATGTAPLVISSTTKVDNLHVARASLADTATTNANLTGPITSSGNTTAIASQTGTGTTFAMQAGPTFTGQVKGDDGSASAPPYSFSSSGNGDNGMFLAASNAVGIAAAGAIVARFDANGVGIGVTPTSEKLQVNGNISVDGFGASHFEYRLRPNFANSAAGGSGVSPDDVDGNTNFDGLGLYGHDGVRVYVAQAVVTTANTVGLGVGVVPASEKFQVSGNIAINGFSGSNEFRLRPNFAVAAAGGAGLTSVDVSGDANKDGLGLYGHDGIRLYTSAGTLALTINASQGASLVGDLAVNTNKFTVAASSGNTVVAGTLGVTGAVSGSSSIADAKGDVRTIPQNSKSAAYTTVLADAGKHILHPSADTTARTFTIDSNANVAYPVGTAITFVNQASAGVITISITSDTMRLAGPGTTGNRTLAANGMATALKVTTTEWLISGTNLS